MTVTANEQYNRETGVQSETLKCKGNISEQTFMSSLKMNGEYADWDPTMKLVRQPQNVLS